MRPGLVVLALVACGPRSSNEPRPLDEDLARTEAPSQATTSAESPRGVAPAGKGLRGGTIARARLVAVLDAGPGEFLRQIEVTPHLTGDRFVGWKLVQLLDRTGPLGDLDIAPGDILLAVNGRPVARPDEFQAVWDSLRTANEIRAQMWRGEQKFELRFAIEPPVAVPAR